MRFVLVVGTMSGLAALMLGAPASATAANAPRTIQVAVHLGSAGGPGSVQVDLQVAEHVSGLGIPQKLADDPLATVAVSGAGTRAISVPVTAGVLRHAESGMATYEFFARFGHQEATAMATLPVAPAPGNVAASEAGVPAVVFSPFQTAVRPGKGPPPCIWAANGKPVEESNLIGQMQVSASPGSDAAWDYSTQADSTFGVAVSGQVSKHYKVDGSFTITQTFSGDGGFTAGPGFNRFVYGHFYRQRYISDMFLGKPICGHNYKTYFPSTVGDSYPHGTRKPSTDPYRGGCAHDPHGLAEMSPRTGHYGADRGRATNYSLAATIYNVTVSGQTGYTNDIHIGYMNHSGLTEYVCGNADLPDSPILWSNNSRDR